MDNQTNSNTGYWVLGITLIMIILIGTVVWRFQNRVNVTVGTATTTPNSGGIMPYGIATVGFGQKVSFEGISITPMALVDDNRCPIDVQCIQAGTVRIAVKYEIDKGPYIESTLTLSTQTNVDKFLVNLVAVDPQKKASEIIKMDDYRFTFEVIEIP